MTVPLRQRPYDLFFIGFFAINALVITYIVDLEQIVVRDPDQFSYPVWPPAPAIDLVHWWGNNYDPLLMARPPFWQMTIWIDLVFFGPFYFFALYAFIRGRNWIKVPALVWSGTMLANVLIILMDERYGVTPAPNFGIVVAANLAWLLTPLLMMWRMHRPFPFGHPQPQPQPQPEQVAA